MTERWVPGADADRRVRESTSRSAVCSMLAVGALAVVAWGAVRARPPLASACVHRVVRRGRCARVRLCEQLRRDARLSPSRLASGALMAATTRRRSRRGTGAAASGSTRCRGRCAPRPSLGSRHRRRRRDRRRRLHRALDRVRARPAGPDAADRGARGRDRRLRRVGPQRRLVLGPVRRQPGGDRQGARPRGGGRAAAGAVRARSTRSARSPTAEGIDAHFVKGGTLELATAPIQVGAAAGPGRGRAGVGLRRGGRRAGSSPDEAAARLNVAGGHGAIYTPALRPGASGAPRPRAGRRGRAARRHDLRADAGRARSRPAGSRPSGGRVQGRRGRARDRGLHRAARAATGARSRRCTRS